MKQFKSFLGFLLLMFLAFNATAMREMTHEIKIGNKSLNGLESVKIEKRQELLANTCLIAVPSLYRGVKLDIEGQIKRGDKVTVKLGYDGDNQIEFEGYLRAIIEGSTKRSARLECEDAMYLTRKYIAPKVLTNVDVSEIVKYVLDQLNPQLQTPFAYTSDIKGYKWDRFVIHNTTAYEVLDKLRQESGLMIYAKGTELHAHLAFTEGVGKLAKYDFYRNIEDSNDLEYMKETDARVKIKVVGRTDKGAKITVESGLDGGDERIFQRPEISSRETLYSIARAEMAKMNYEGYRGSIRGWLVPYCEPGYAVELGNGDDTSRKGRYYAQGVEVEFSKNGGIRTIELGRKLS